MLNSIEKYILNSFLEIYEFNINNYIDKNKSNYNIIFDNIHISQKIIDLFYEKNNNFSYIFYLSTMYSFTYNNINYLKYIKKIDFFNSNIHLIDNDFKRECLYNAIKYLLLKNKYKINLNEEEKALKNKYINHTNKLEFIFNLKELQKIIIIKLLQKYEHIKYEVLLDAIITTNNYDNDIKEVSYGFINTNDDIKYIKEIIKRFIISNMYIVEFNVENTSYKLAENKIGFKITEEMKDIIPPSPTRKHLNNCIKNKSYSLPTDKNLLHYYLNSYLYTLFNEEMEKEFINNIKKEHIKELKKINPLYNF